MRRERALDVGVLAPDRLSILPVLQDLEHRSAEGNSSIHRVDKRRGWLPDTSHRYMWNRISAAIRSAIVPVRTACWPSAIWSARELLARDHVAASDAARRLDTQAQLEDPAHERAIERCHHQPAAPGIDEELLLFSSNSAWPTGCWSAESRSSNDSLGSVGRPAQGGRCRSHRGSRDTPARPSWAVAQVIPFRPSSNSVMSGRNFRERTPVLDFPWSSVHRGRHFDVYPRRKVGSG